MVRTYLELSSACTDHLSSVLHIHRQTPKYSNHNRKNSVTKKHVQMGILRYKAFSVTNADDIWRYLLDGSMDVSGMLRDHVSSAINKISVHVGNLF